MIPILKQISLGIPFLLLHAVTVGAVGFTNLYSFSATSGNPSYTNSDGSEPNASLVLSGSTLYGTTHLGGTSNFGAVFKVNIDGTGFTNLYNFSGSDGKGPNAALVLSGNSLYGTAVSGGSANYGTVFRMTTNGSAFTNLYNFSYSIGYSPYGTLILSGNTLYGTTYAGGSGFDGTIFKINTDGSGFTNFVNFNASTGAYLYGGLVSSGNTLYGTTAGGLGTGNGTVFRVDTDGSVFTNLHSFTATSGFPATNSDGRTPNAALVLSGNGNTLYGTTRNGGTGGNGNGTVFSVNTDGAGFTALHSFSATSGSLTTNNDGAVPYAGLVLSGNTLYGATALGGSQGSGTIFKINVDGTGFTTLYTFTVAVYNNTLGVSTNSDGAYPYASLLLSGNTLYGTTQQGTRGGSGTVFEFTLPSAPVPIPLNIRSIGNAVVLSWTDPATAFSLYTSPAVTGPWSTVSGATSPYTNPFTGSQEFFRLQSK